MPRGHGGHGFGARQAGTPVEFSGVAPAAAGAEEGDRERQVRLAGAEAWHVFVQTGRGESQGWGQRNVRMPRDAMVPVAHCPSMCLLVASHPPRGGVWDDDLGRQCPSKAALPLPGGSDRPAGTIEFHFSKQQSASQRGENERKEMSAPTKEEHYSK